MTTTSNTSLNIQGQALSLKRFPANQFDKSLRAWDAADEYTIDHVASTFTLSETSHIVIVNDSFGALTCAMAKLAPQAKISVYTDSYMSEQGILQNLKGSNLDKNNVTIFSSLNIHNLSTSYGIEQNHEQDKKHPHKTRHSNYTPIDLILLKVPRTLSYLDYLLNELSHVIKEMKGTDAAAPPQMVSSGMVKLVTSSAMKIFESTTASTTTSLARKKSRLIFSQFRSKINNDHATTNKIPSETKEYNGGPIQSSPTYLITDEQLPFTLHNYPNVFCREQVDIGARYMLKSLPKITKDKQVIIDLGCGNGILGTSLLLQYAHKSPKMIYVDESYMAIASAKATIENSNVEEDVKSCAEFIVGHCLSSLISQQNNVINVSDTSNAAKVFHDFPGADMILCNPPFHQQNTVIDDIAWQMFVDAKKVLKVGGELRIVGNRHLDHRAKLSKLFGGCNVVASDNKFVVLSAIKQA